MNEPRMICITDCNTGEIMTREMTADEIAAIPEAPDDLAS